MAELLRGAEIVIETLLEQGADEVFGYPGSAVLPIYDALHMAQGKLRHIHAADEQGAAHAADGYARVTGKVGVVIATSGPGATNLVTGIATAMLDSVPMVIITGNVATNQIGTDAFQEINITGITMPITKHNYFVTDVAELADSIREAFRIAKSGRPGPVLVDIPKDVQEALCPFEKGEIVPPFPSPTADEMQIKRAVSLINNAKRPYIYIGGGASGANLTDKIIALAEKIDACVGCTFKGLSVMPKECPRYLGMQGMHGLYASSMANREADVVIALGVRFSDRATGKVEKYANHSKIIQIDTDISEIGKNVPADIGIVGDIDDAFTRLLNGCKKRKHPAWHELFEALKSDGAKIRDAADAFPADVITPKRVFDIINAAKGEDTIIATDVGQHQMWTAQFADFHKPRRFVSSGGLGTMGYGMGAAIGASIAEKERVILITGDGSFGMNLNELATAVTYRIPLIIVLMNNGILGMVHQWQEFFFDGHYQSTVLERKTDFVKLAEAFGARASRAATLSEFRTAFEAALNSDAPYLIDTLIDPEMLVLPMLPPGGSVDDIIVKQTAENHSGH